MMFFSGTVCILLASWLLFAASGQPVFKSGKLVASIRRSARTFRIVSAMLLLLACVLIFLHSGFAVSIFYTLTVLMTALSCFVLFPPILFRQPEKPRSNARK